VSACRDAHKLGSREDLLFRIHLLHPAGFPLSLMRAQFILRYVAYASRAPMPIAPVRRLVVSAHTLI
jgi:hypothetical protein